MINLVKQISGSPKLFLVGAGQKFKERIPNYFIEQKDFFFIIGVVSLAGILFNPRGSNYGIYFLFVGIVSLIVWYFKE